MEENNNINKSTDTDNVSKPATLYWTRSEIEDQPRMVPISDVLKHGMTLEESERLITEKIYRHFHPEA